jgi:hypothetical protein
MSLNVNVIQVVNMLLSRNLAKVRKQKEDEEIISEGHL